jgi:uncharacterized protein
MNRAPLMNRTSTMCAAICFAAIGVPAAVGAPSFDCAKAQGDVEQLICRDATLAALDQQLADTYKAAVAKARDDMPGILRTEQRGWIGGRNECWKATERTWITATWTVDSVRDCIDAQYRLRISELQAVWQLLPPETVFYTCNGNAADGVVASYFASDPPTIRLERGDRTATLWRVPQGGDARYEGQNVSLVRKGGNVAVELLDVNSGDTERLNCAAD